MAASAFDLRAWVAKVSDATVGGERAVSVTRLACYGGIRKDLPAAVARAIPHSLGLSRLVTICTDKYDWELVGRCDLEMGSNHGRVCLTAPQVLRDDA